MTTTDDIYIEPYPIDQSIDHVKIKIEDFRLNALDCWCSVYEYDSNDKFINMSRVYVPSDVYTQWSTDDEYIIQYCLNQLGFHPKQPVNIDFSS